MDISFAKRTAFGWHIMLDEKERPFSIKLSFDDVDAALRRPVSADDFADVEQFLSTDPNFKVAVRSLEKMQPNPYYPSIEEF
jgi:hypothetical protein